MAIPTTGDEGIYEGMGLKCKNHDKDLGTQTTIHNNVLTLFRMKKTRVLGVALTLAATMAVGSAMGQMTNYVEIKKATVGTNGTSVDDTAFVQVGLKYGFYAKPDGAFHPSYNAATNTGLTAGFTWTWTQTPATGLTINNAVATAPANYVEITSGALVTTSRVSVQEAAPSAWGISCTGSAFDFYLTSFPEPTIAKKTGGDEGTKFCAYTNPAKLNFTVESSGTPHFIYVIEKSTNCTFSTTDGSIIDGSFTTVATNTVKTFTPAANWNYNVVKDTKTADLVGNIDGTQVTVTNPLSSGANRLATYNVLIQKAITAPVTADPVVTAYRVTLVQTNGLISRNADYKQLDGTASTESFYPTTAKTPNATNSHVYYVVKVPTTGPVFHIGNNKAA